MTISDNFAQLRLKDNPFKCDFSGLKLTPSKAHYDGKTSHFVQQCINARQLLFIRLVLERKETQ